jgi:hypothetical protein
MQSVINYQMNQQTITVLNLKVLNLFRELFLCLSMDSFLIRNLVRLGFILNLLSRFEALSQLSIASVGHVIQSILIG